LWNVATQQLLEDKKSGKEEKSGEGSSMESGME
jgi:hypothetical protein